MVSVFYLLIFLIPYKSQKRQAFWLTCTCQNLKFSGKIGRTLVADLAYVIVHHLQSIYQTLRGHVTVAITLFAIYNNTEKKWSSCLHWSSKSKLPVFKQYDSLNSAKDMTILSIGKQALNSNSAKSPFQHNTLCKAVSPSNNLSSEFFPDPNVETSFTKLCITSTSYKK